MKIIKVPGQVQTITTPEQNWVVVKVEYDYAQKTGTVTLFNGDIGQFPHIFNNPNIKQVSVPFVDLFDDESFSSVAKDVSPESEVVETVEPVEVVEEATVVTPVEPAVEAPVAPVEAPVEALATPVDAGVDYSQTTI